METQAISTKLKELEQAVEEAKRSGTVYRPEHKGFDIAIYSAQIEPLIKELGLIEREMSQQQKQRFVSLKEQVKRELP
ncbi:hypothetical protein [Adlercreutzia equolifaciens]|uniref:hypothetical protein n=1 Tax=Adlercreutzia equolifaciens TaxID=446660 RepID=UPI00267260E6|nr:hypothetical protein [uncultured Adlercreutzia sp.]